MKIISGKYKNRIIKTLKTADYKPTTSKFRESLFSILSSGEFFHSQPIIGSKILDLFAGTGILSFEALSRGAESATLIDINPEHLKAIEKAAEKIAVQKDICCKLLDISALPESSEKYNIVFMDPPYYNDLCTKILEKLITHNWLENKAIIAMEMEKNAKIPLEKFYNLRLIKEKIYTNSKLLIVIYEQS